MGSANAGAMSGNGNTSRNGGGGGGLGDLINSPVGKAVMAGAAAFAMKEMLGRR